MKSIKTEKLDELKKVIKEKNLEGAAFDTEIQTLREKVADLKEAAETAKGVGDKAAFMEAKRALPEAEAALEYAVSQRRPEVVVTSEMVLDAWSEFAKSHNDIVSQLIQKYDKTCSELVDLLKEITDMQNTAFETRGYCMKAGSISNASEMAALVTFDKFEDAKRFIEDGKLPKSDFAYFNHVLRLKEHCTHEESLAYHNLPITLWANHHPVAGTGLTMQGLFGK